MSVLVDGAIAAAGLADVVEKRRRGDVGSIERGRLLAADLLAVGALADRVRAEEVGTSVRVITSSPMGERGTSRPPLGSFATVGVALLPPVGWIMTGFELLREVAIARLTGPHAATVRVDFSRCGLELAQNRPGVRGQ